MRKNKKGKTNKYLKKLKKKKQPPFFFKTFFFSRRAKKMFDVHQMTQGYELLVHQSERAWASVFLLFLLNRLLADGFAPRPGFDVCLMNSHKEPCLQGQSCTPRCCTFLPLQPGGSRPTHKKMNTAHVAAITAAANTSRCSIGSVLTRYRSDQLHQGPSSQRQSAGNFRRQHSSYIVVAW